MAFPAVSRPCAALEGSVQRIVGHGLKNSELTSVCFYCVCARTQNGKLFSAPAPSLALTYPTRPDPIVMTNSVLSRHRVRVTPFGRTTEIQ